MSPGPPRRLVQRGLRSPPLEAPKGSIVAARLLKGDEVLSRFTLWPEPYKYLTPSHPNLKVLRIAEDKLLLHCEKPIKGLWLEAREVEWSDNMLDLNPGDERVIEASGLGNQRLRVRYMGSRGALVAEDVLETVGAVGD